MRVRINTTPRRRQNQPLCSSNLTYLIIESTFSGSLLVSVKQASDRSTFASSLALNCISSTGIILRESSSVASIARKCPVTKKHSYISEFCEEKCILNYWVKVQFSLNKETVCMFLFYDVTLPVIINIQCKSSNSEVSSKPLPN